MGSVLGGLFGGGSKKKDAPKVAAPEPIKAVDPRPLPEELDTSQKDRDKRRAQLAQSGRKGTILTQGQSLAGSATLLGRSNA